MDEEDGETPPFWLQTSNNIRRVERHHRRRPSSSVFLDSGVLLILLLFTAILFVFLIVPKILSLSVQIFQPSSVKKGWDSLNLLLVLFASVCGFLSRNKDDGGETPVADRSVSSNVLSRRQLERSNSSTSRNWYEYSDRKVYNPTSDATTTTTTTDGFMRRNCSSYPDLRQGFINGEDRWRFCDDTEVNEYRVWGSDHLHRRRPPREELDGDVSKIKSIIVEDLATTLSGPPPSSTRSFEAIACEEEKVEDSASAAESEMWKPQTPSLSSPPPPSVPPPATPPALKIRRRTRRSSESLARKQNAENPACNVGNFETPEAQSSHPLITAKQQSEQKRRRDDRKRIGSSSSTKEFLTSLYHQRKRKKKQRHKSLDNFDTILDLSTTSSAQLHSPRSTPPPLFKNLFSSKKGKTKRSHSVSPPLTSTARRALETKAQLAVAQSDTIAAYKPLFPVKTRIPDTFFDENVSSGTQSPSIPIPPPPPFRIPDWKFSVQGDFVRLLSDQSSRSVSPDPDQTEESARAAAVTGDATTAMFCPSPDVDTKADSFIARFRAGLKLEKINSIKEKQGLGLSSLGPGPRSGPESNNIT